MGNEGLGSWLERRRIKSAGRTALIFDGRAISYGTLADRAAAFAGALHDRGIRAGDRVAYLGDNHPSFLESLFAVTQLGAIFVPLNTRLAAPELAYLLADSGSRVLIHADSHAQIAHASLALSPVELVIGVDAAGADGLEAVIATGSPLPHEAEVTLDDPALILYTSGTTGHPKGAVLTHGNLTWNCLNVLIDYDIVSTDVALMISPLFHAASLGMGALPILMKGGTIVLEVRFDAERALDLIERHRITTISGVPTTFQLLSEHPKWNSTDLSSLEKITCGGSPVPMRVLEAFEARGLSFTGGYGLTEAAPGATSLHPAYSRAKAGSAGLPHFFSRLRIVDGDGEHLPPGEPGEIQVWGRNVIPHYWRQPEASDASFAEGRWLRTGDVGYRDDEGFLYISDRLKDMIISGAENIYPAEIEQLILELTDVTAVAVIGVPDDRWGEVPWAVVTLHPDATIEPDHIVEHLSGRIAKYKIPKRVIVVDELPRTASGKIRKNVLRETFPG